jgi:hypothetical protein
VDWNGDGHLDILSGCYWTQDTDAGHIQWLAGNGTLDFAAARAVLDASGKPLENVRFRDDSEKQQKQTLTICTQQHAVDYDGDGDLDLVVGCFGNNFFLYENRGKDGQPELSETPVELPVTSTSYHAAPHLVDWDKDGDLDLLSGTAAGGVIYSENVGTRQKPEWSPFRQLVAGSDLHQQTTAGGQEIAPSPSTRVWAFDWNRDGWLDLLVGDSATIVNPKEGISQEEFAERQKEFNEKMLELQKKQQPIYQRYQEAMQERQEGEQLDEKLMEELQAVQREFSQLYSSRSEFQDEQRTGFVWLYVRKPHSP